MALTILFVPGFWEGPLVFNSVVALLEKGKTSPNAEGLGSQIAPLVSTGKTSPGNPTMSGDIAAVRGRLTELVEDKGKEVLIVAHSAGGFIGADAMEGMAIKTRKEGGLRGGVIGIVFLTAGIALEGYEHTPKPFFDVKGNAMYCINTRHTLLSDLDDVEAERWMSRLQCQPAENWGGKTTYCGWRDVPSTYLICEGDRLLPTALQEQFAQLAGSEVERCSAGHMCMLTATEKVADVIRRTVERLRDV